MVQKIWVQSPIRHKPLAKACDPSIEEVKALCDSGLQGSLGEIRRACHKQKKTTEEGGEMVLYTLRTRPLHDVVKDIVGRRERRARGI